MLIRKPNNKSPKLARVLSVCQGSDGGGDGGGGEPFAQCQMLRDEETSVPVAAVRRFSGRVRTTLEHPI